MSIRICHKARAKTVKILTNLNLHEVNQGIHCEKSMEVGGPLTDQ